MIESDPVHDLQKLIDERWSVVQTRVPWFADATEGWRLTPHRLGSLTDSVSPAEAASFLASVTASKSGQPLLVVHDDSKLQSDRYPPVADGSPRGYVFFEQSGRMGGCRLETIVHWAAMARLVSEFGWPREHLIAESPTVTKDGIIVLGYDALDILVTERPCPQLASKMALEALQPRVAVEAKADAKLLTKLIDEMRGCRDGTVPSTHGEHKKCIAVAELRPHFFLGVAAGDTWRPFTVIERDGRAVIGEELPDLECLHSTR